ncbi:hypothetical protein K3F43_04310 [Pseudomonas tussilaginis]|jgi:hypothetical protein|uniref:hypothetical protein n=1 Tax=unclassified Pseudomonas TaxID=196821 RepID=UPI000C6C8B9A|nr:MULTISPECIES: hypothetical protein [unclassified Pseudomonas]QYX48735.1 hypothetical protein K3F43_04310 [Pseudomonas sp. S11A 273]
MDLYSIIDRRAQQMLRDTVSRFDQYMGYDGAEGVRAVSALDHCLAANDLVLEHRLSSKVIGRIYTCRWRWKVAVDLGAASMVIRLRYRGWKPSSRTASFVGNPGSRGLRDQLSASAVVLPLCVAMELGGLCIRYHAVDKTCEVELSPNYGDFVWMLIPPVKYGRQPTPAEVDSTVLLIQHISLIVQATSSLALAS